MASFNSPMAEFFPIVDVEVGNELFWYIFDGEPKPVDGYIDLRDDVPRLGVSVAAGSGVESVVLAGAGLGHGPAHREV